jgi:hypothetical protein
MRFGFGAWLDALTGIVLGALILLLGALGVSLALLLCRWILRHLPIWPAALFVVAAAWVGLFWPSPLAGILLVVCAAGIAANVASLLRGHFREMARQRQIVTIVLLTLLVAFAGVTAWLLTWRGFEKDLADAPLSKQPAIAALSLPDPSQNGPYKVVAFTYGPGTDRHRAEYGRGIALKSRTVDGSKLFKGPEGWRGKLYQWYWGFDSKQMPLNARVWCPDGAGPFPLVLIVHGNHGAMEFSDPGYAYLGELLASRGYIAASIDENFINSSWIDALSQKETALRGWLLLEHLKLFREWNSTAGHRFSGKVDLDRIALIGHSRGGEAVATASAFNRLSAFPDDATQKFDYHLTSARSSRSRPPTASTNPPASNGR